MIHSLLVSRRAAVSILIGVFWAIAAARVENSLHAGAPARNTLSEQSPEMQLHATPVVFVNQKPFTGKELYRRNCIACHGDRGDGLGQAARYLFPKPRNFRGGRFRLIGSENREPAIANIEKVILNGMPSSSMPAWPKFTEQERRLLAKEVLRLYREGAAEQYIKLLRQEDETPDTAEVEQFVQRRTKPLAAIEVPAFGQASPQSIARGKELYLKQSCHTCHGERGLGDGIWGLVDDNGYPTRPRNLVQEPFKGGSDRESVYLRIYLGMPGSPMPSSRNLTEQQMIDLVNYCSSLSREPKLKLTNYQRSQQALRRNYSPAKRQ